MLKLLYPGIKIKRWLLLGSIGIGISSIGFVYFVRRIFLLTFPDFLPWHLEAIILLTVGSGIIFSSLLGLYRTLSPLLIGSPTLETIGETLYSRLSRERGPKISVLGGGTGMSVLLSGLKEHTNNLTAIISVADDGGSSGRLRRELGVIPPGDFRNCIVAMSDEQTLLPELFQYRFEEGEGLKGHSFGNLFIVAMSQVANGFENALSESSRVLAVRGTIAPATTENLHLSAKLSDGTVIEGESSITEHGGIVEKLSITPQMAEAYKPAVEAIMESEIVVMGPGSLYTSILPNLMVPGIKKAILQTKAKRVYVCNVATELGETQGFDVADHLKALRKHTDANIADCVIANNNINDIGDKYQGEAVSVPTERIANVQLVLGDLIDESHPIRHDPSKLARFILKVCA